MIIYGIRDVASGEIRYVGRAANLASRKASRYSKTVEAWMRENAYDYVELARCGDTDEEAHTAELSMYDQLTAKGCRLLNGERPKPLGKDPDAAARVALRLSGDLYAACVRMAESDSRTLSDWIRRVLKEKVRSGLTGG